jgi:hypothetical protein
MTDVVDVLLAAGATDLVAAAAAGDITGTLTADTPQPDRVAALRIAAAHGRSDVIDRLLAAATPVDGVDRDGSTALHEAAFCGRADSVRQLLRHGADPARRDTRFDSTPLGWCRHQREETGPGHGHEEVERVLAPITPNQPLTARPLHSWLTPPACRLRPAFVAKSGAVPQESRCPFQLVGEENSVVEVTAGFKSFLSPLTDELRYPDAPRAGHLMQPVHGVPGKAHRARNHRLANVDRHGRTALPFDEEVLVAELFVVLRETLDLVLG